MLRCCSTAATHSSWYLGRQEVLVGCGNCDGLCDLVLIEGGAAAFVAVAFFDLVLFAGYLVDSDIDACEEDPRRTRWRLDVVLVVDLGDCS